MARRASTAPPHILNLAHGSTRHPNWGRGGEFSSITVPPKNQAFNWCSENRDTSLGDRAPAKGRYGCVWLQVAEIGAIFVQFTKELSTPTCAPEARFELPPHSLMQPPGLPNLFVCDMIRTDPIFQATKRPLNLLSRRRSPMAWEGGLRSGNLDSVLPSTESKDLSPWQ